MNSKVVVKKIHSEEKQRTKNFSQLVKAVQAVKNVGSILQFSQGVSRPGGNAGKFFCLCALLMGDLAIMFIAVSFVTFPCLLSNVFGFSRREYLNREVLTPSVISFAYLGPGFVYFYTMYGELVFNPMRVAADMKEMQRVMYARKHQGMQRNPVIGGVPITEEQATDLRQTVFGSCVAPPRGEWLRTGFVFREADQELAYGLKAPRNGTRGLLSVVQAHVIKYFLFEKKGVEGSTPEKLLKPSKNRQMDALWTALAAIIWTVGEKKSCTVCLPQEHPSLQHSSTYFADGLTEFLYLFEFNSLDDLQIFIKRYVYLFQEDPGPGVLLLLYSAVLTRGTAKVRMDMEDDKSYLVTSAEEGSNCIITLLLTGRATPYLHNGVVYVGDEDHYARPQWGIMTRSDVGFLFYDETCDSKNLEECKQPGSRLKTPRLPVWVVNCSGHYAVLFNTNSELLRNYHAERRFDLYYYSVGGSHSLLSVDTRYHEKQNENREAGKGEEAAPITTTNPLEKLIHSKWQDAYIQWNGMVPFA